MPILHSYGLQGLFRDLFVFLREPVFHFHAKSHHGHDFSLWFFPTHCLLCRCFPSPFLSYIPVNFNVLRCNVLLYENQFFISMQKNNMVMTSASGSSHTLSSLQVFPLSMPILHSSGLQGFFSFLFFYMPTSFSLSCLKSLFPNFGLWYFPCTLSSLQVFPFSMPILHSYELQGLSIIRFFTRTSFSLPC